MTKEEKAAAKAFAVLYKERKAKKEAEKGTVDATLTKPPPTKGSPKGEDPKGKEKKGNLHCHATTSESMVPVAMLTLASSLMTQLL